MLLRHFFEKQIPGNKAILNTFLLLIRVHTFLQKICYYSDNNPFKERKQICEV